MARREELESALAKAEAALADAVSNSSGLDTDRDEANASLEQTRAFCRRARAALAELKRSERASRSSESIDTMIRQLLEIPRRKTAATPPLRQSNEHGGRGEKNKRSKPGPRGARASPSLLRRSIGLLALVLAYLQFFYLDVQLDILRLPTIFGWSLQ